MGKFKVDENLPAESTLLLTAAGHDASTVPDQKLGGQSDPTIATICQNEGRAIVTLDLDFADIRRYPPADFSGIIVFRLVRQDKHTLLNAIGRLVLS